MNLGIKNKVAIVVGASRGIGAAVAQTFAEEGSRLALLSRGREDLDALAGNLSETHPGSEVITITGDATDPRCADAVVQEVLARMGRVDILVNNAGAGVRRPFEELTDPEWSAALELNLLAAIRFSRAVLPHMKKQRDGRIINVGAVSAMRPRRGQIASNVAKAGLVNFTRSLAIEVAPHKILVNAVCPGSIDTPRRSLRIETPLGRLGKPEEVAGIIAFLAGIQATFITGAVINVDGGLEVGIL